MSGPDGGRRPERPERVRNVVSEVVRQALVDRGAARVAILDDGSPEARILTEWLTRSLGDSRVVTVDRPPPEVEPLLRSSGAGARMRREALRMAARLMDDVVVASPENRTALLLGGALPPEPLLPLGDLFASQVMELGGGWSAPPEVVAMAERAGGIHELDAGLAALLDGRDPAALDALPDEVRAEVREALARGSAARRSPYIVPKLSYRTLGIDLFQ